MISIIRYMLKSLNDEIGKKQRLSRITFTFVDSFLPEIEIGISETSLYAYHFTCVAAAVKEAFNEQSYVPFQQLIQFLLSVLFLSAYKNNKILH